MNQNTVDSNAGVFCLSSLIYLFYIVPKNLVNGSGIHNHNQCSNNYCCNPLWFLHKKFLRSYSTTLTFLISETNSFAGLNAGIKCSGMCTAMFFLILRPIFAALFLVIKLPKPRM